MTKATIFGVIVAFALATVGKADMLSSDVEGEVLWVNPEERTLRVREKGTGMERTFVLYPSTRIKFGSKERAELTKDMVGHTIRLHPVK